MTVAISLEGVHVIDSREKVPPAPPRWDLREVSERKGAGPLLRLSWFPGVCRWLGAGWMACREGPCLPRMSVGLSLASWGLFWVCSGSAFPPSGHCRGSAAGSDTNRRDSAGPGSSTRPTAGAQLLVFLKSPSAGALLGCLSPASPLADSWMPALRWWQQPPCVAASLHLRRGPS